MPAITRQMLERAEHVRVLYVEYQKMLRESVKAGARLEPGCDAILDQDALETEIPAFTIDLSRFGAKWTAEMKTLLRSASDNRRGRLAIFRALLNDFDFTASVAVKAYMRHTSDADNWARAQSFVTHAVHLRVAVWGLRLAALMFWARLPQAASLTERCMDMLQEFLAVIRPTGVVVPIR
jgi:hypothetical protein